MGSRSGFGHRFVIILGSVTYCHATFTAEAYSHTQCHWIDGKRDYVSAGIEGHAAEADSHG